MSQVQDISVSQSSLFLYSKLPVCRRHSDFFQGTKPQGESSVREDLGGRDAGIPCGEFAYRSAPCMSRGGHGRMQKQ